MSSRFDYSDPGTDPAYCNQLGGHPGIERHCTRCGEVVYVSRGDEYQVQVFCQRCQDRPSSTDGWDAAEHAATNILRELGALETELAKVSTLERAWALRHLTDMLHCATQQVYNRVVDKIDALQVK